MTREDHPDGEFAAARLAALALSSCALGLACIYFVRDDAIRLVCATLLTLLLMILLAERRRLNASLRAALARAGAFEAELLEVRDHAETAAATKAEFMASMTHEIRTPLTAVLGFTSLLASRTDLPDDARARVDRIGAAGQAMLAIVNDILDFSKLEAGHMAAIPRRTRPSEVLETALALFETQVAAKGLSLSFRAEGLPEHARLDPDRTRQVLLNLVGNAVKFTEAGTVEVTARYDAAHGRLKVAVRDSARA